MIGLTIGLLLVAAAQAWMFWRQLRIMSDGLRDTKQAADAASMSARATQESVGLAADTAERQLRAYVLLLEISLDVTRDIPLPQAGTASYTLSIKNFGLTPAYDVSVAARIRLHPRESGEFIAANIPGEPRGTLPPGGITYVNLQGDSGAEMAMMIRRDEFAIYLFGRIDYVDTFGVKRYSEFRFERKRYAHDFVASSEGNDSD